MADVIIPNTPPAVSTAPLMSDSKVDAVLNELNGDEESSRPGSKTTGTTDSPVAEPNNGENGTADITLMGMDNDATTLGQVTTESRGSSSVMDEKQHSDTEHDDVGPCNNIDDIIKPSTDENNQNEQTRRRSTSSSSDIAAAAIPGLLDDRRRRSNSTCSSTSLRQHTSSTDSHPTHPKHIGRLRKTSSVDAPDTTPTTVNSESGSPRHSATEFQKFRDQLHSSQANPAFQSEHDAIRLHPNPHHPKTKTEILRIERTYTPIALPIHSRVSTVTNFDVLIPRFSPSYPPILREYGVSDNEWTTFIHRVNKSCMEAFDPLRWTNIAINIIALLSCWLSEWIMPNPAKRVFHGLALLMTETNGAGEIY